MAAQRRRTAHETPLPPGRVRVQVEAEMPPESDHSSAACFRATYDGEPVKVTLRGVPTIVTLRRNLEAYGSCALECNTWEMSLLTEADRRRISEAQAKGGVATLQDGRPVNVGDGDNPAALAASVDEALATLNEQARDALG